MDTIALIAVYAMLIVLIILVVAAIFIGYILHKTYVKDPFREAVKAASQDELAEAINIAKMKKRRRRVTTADVAMVLMENK